MAQQFQCPECEYQATQKGALVTHHKSVHMGRKFDVIIEILEPVAPMTS